MAYIFPSEGSLDYFPCFYGNSRIQFRGPKRDTDVPYAAFLGGTETYGKFVRQPFPELLEQALGMPMLNLGCVNAGPDVFVNESELMKIAAKARIKVVQILGAQNISNRYYAVHPRRNDRFLGASPILKALFPKVDFTEFNFTRHMLMALQHASIDRFEVVAEELRAAWVSRMTQLLAGLGGKIVLLWMADAPPPQPERRVDLMRNPLLIDQEMVNALRSKAAIYVESVYSKTALAQGCAGMAFAPMETAAALALPGPAVHSEVAATLLPEVARLLR